MTHDINGYLMSKDTVIAKITDGVLTGTNKKLLPLYLLRTQDVEGFLKMRAIDSHRPNSRLIKKALRLAEKDDVSTVLNVNAVTITDTYWVKPLDSNLSYADVKFNKNYFDKLALYGDVNSFSQGYSRTPELTNTGSFEKCWRLENEKWWLYKQGNQKELFSELFICRLGEALGFNMLHYAQSGEYIKSCDFTGGASVNYEPAYGIVGDNEDYTVSYDAFKELNESIINDFINMIFLDTICLNMDRHTLNYGVLRDVENGNVMSLAPNFDNNIALISRGYLKNIGRKNDLLVELFCEFILKNKIDYKIPYVTAKMINEITDELHFDVDKKYVSEFVMNGYKNVIRCLEKEMECYEEWER